MLNKSCEYCIKPFETLHSKARFCSDSCRAKSFRKGKSKQDGINQLGLVTEQSNTLQPNQQSTMPSTAEFLLQQRISELKEMISELKSDKKQLESKLETEREKRSQLEVQVNTIEKNHASELSGIEQGKRTLVTELIEVAKSKEAMDGIANLVSSFKGGDKPGSALPESETDEFKAVRTIYNAIPPSDQNMFLEMLYVYKQRPELMAKQHEELKQIVNNQ